MSPKRELKISTLLSRKAQRKRNSLRERFNLPVRLEQVFLKPPHFCVCPGCERARRTERNRYRRLKGLEPEPILDLPEFKNCQCYKCEVKRKRSRKNRIK